MNNFAIAYKGKIRIFPEIRNKKGEAALQLAMDRGHTDIGTLLAQAQQEQYAKKYRELYGTMRWY